MAFFLGSWVTPDTKMKYVNDCFHFLQVFVMLLGSPCGLKVLEFCHCWNLKLHHEDDNYFGGC